MNTPNWFEEAVSRVSQMDVIDSSNGWRTPNACGATATLMTAFEAFDAAMRMIDTGEIARAKEIAAEAMVYALGAASMFTQKYGVGVQQAASSKN
jgi:uncharacterized protein YcbX